MSVRDIRLLGDPALREACEPVEAFDEAVRGLARDLLDTMYEAEGVGLAAPQVGVTVRMFAYDVRDPELPAGVLVNPEVVDRSGSQTDEEGCLSVPGLSARVERARRVVVEGLDPEGEEVRIEAEDLLARCLLHEIDHLDGVLFLDHLSPLKRKLLLDRWSKREAEPEASAAGTGS